SRLLRRCRGGPVDLEDLPAQPPCSNGLDRLLHRAHEHDEGAVRGSLCWNIAVARCRIFNVMEHPSAAWTSQQIVEAFAGQNPPRYLLRVRDRIYGNEIRLRIASVQMEEVLESLAESAPRRFRLVVPLLSQLPD